MRLLFSFLMLAMIAACNRQDREDSASKTGNSFIDPPFSDVQKPFENYSVEAEHGDTLFHHSGSMLLFHPSAFLDKDGKVVTGKVDIKYREFNNPVDFYLAGIPMEYDSAGTGYTLESSGMWEILAFRNGEPVFVNPQSKPEIILKSSTDASGHNVYYLDSVKRNWVYEEPSVAVSITGGEIHEDKNVLMGTESALQPVMPRKVEGDRPVIQLRIDTASFKELMVYDNLKFQVNAEEKSFRGEDADEIWTDMELQKDGVRGSYKIKFTNPDKTVSYKVKPVFEGEDFDKAMKVFEKTNARFKKDMAARLAKQEQDKLQYARDTFRNLQIEKENARIAHLNRLAEIHNRNIDSLDAKILRENRERELAKEAMAENNRFYRSFSITRFGIHNFDIPLQPEYIPITAHFIDDAGKMLAVSNLAVVYSNLNGIRRYPDNNIRISKQAETMIFGKVDGRFGYVNYDVYRKIEIPEGATTIKMPMTVVAEENNNYEFIAALAARG